MECPRCGGPLAARSFGSIALDGCARCGGVWFDCDELKRLTRDPEAGLMSVERAFAPALSAVLERGAMRCPRCADPLEPFRFEHTPEVGLDVCRPCRGIWLDDGEMEAISRRVARARPEGERGGRAPDAGQMRVRHVAAFLVSAVCGRCGRPNPSSALSCHACDAELGGHPTLRLCPRCDHPMRELREAAAAVEACVLCSGIWFDGGKLAVLMRYGVDAVEALQRSVLTARAAAGAGASHVARCPACHWDLERTHFGASRSLLVDVCGVCRGVWLDAGELMAARAVLERDGLLGLSGPADAWGAG